jgi:hypothetical protein
MTAGNGMTILLEEKNSTRKLVASGQKSLCR